MYNGHMYMLNERKGKLLEVKVRKIDPAKDGERHSDTFIAINTSQEKPKTTPKTTTTRPVAGVAANKPVYMSIPDSDEEERSQRDQKAKEMAKKSAKPQKKYVCDRCQRKKILHCNGSPDGTPCMSCTLARRKCLFTRHQQQLNNARNLPTQVKPATKPPRRTLEIG